MLVRLATRARGGGAAAIEQPRNGFAATKSSGRRLRLACGLLPFLLVVVPSPTAALGAAQPGPNPDQLWRAFPLAPQVNRDVRDGASSTSFRPPRAPRAVEPASASTDRTVVVLALAGGASLALLLLLFAFRPLPTKIGGITMSSFIRRRSDGPAGEKLRDLGDAPSRVDEAVTSYTLRGDDHAPKEPGEEDGAMAARGIVSYDELGQTIANVLRSAQDNAAQITATARAQAQSTREAAEAEAKEARVQLETEMAERRAESERIRAVANRYAEVRRRDADIEANQLRVDAEAEARKLRDAGEAAKRTLEATGLARRQELMEASSSMEARLRDALETCRAVTGQIEELVGKEPKLDEELLDEVRGAEQEEEPEEEQEEAAKKAS
jgi:hypothetical protein